MELSPTGSPTVSVVIATSRGGPYLAEALQSLEAQTYPGIESVLVDDGSQDPDGVTAITDRFPSLTVIRQANAGVSVARNNGVSHTRGDLLVFLDDDDRWHPDRIRHQVHALVARPSAVLSYCGMRTVDAAGNELVRADQRQVDSVHDVIRRRTGILLPNIMIRRETFLRVGGFHPVFKRAQDLDLVLKAAMEGEFAFVPETLVDYRYHGANSTRRHRELCRSIDHILRLHRWADQEWGGGELVADYDASLAANGRFALWSVARAARGLIASGNPGSAVKEVVWALRFAPTAPLSAVHHRITRRR